MSGVRTTVDRTEAEPWESERNRVAWNLPLGTRLVPAEPAREDTAKDGRPPPDHVEKATADG